MKQIILGTAGHIDHGKTTLIKAISGIDTDRLKEEKQRGITIELGFASLDLPGGHPVGIVDVPGHEKFVKNMVAGATGIDIVAMVIAADEGVMPQTREHMEICSLLGIRHGLVALTKIDMVDEEWLELVTEDIREFTRGSFLENAPIVPVSAASGQGIDLFIDTLATLCADIPARSAGSLFRLPIDRVFSMKGFGTVITGTLASGRISVGESVMIFPSKIVSKVRGLQVHNRSVETAEAGMRTAINFQGIERATIGRGEVVARPDSLKPGYMVDLSFHYLAGNRRPIKNRTRVRFHTGTSEVLGNLILLESDELPPGETGLAQIRLETPVVVVKDDRFVVRSYSPVRTIGGGEVLNPIAPKHKRLKSEVVDTLKRIQSGSPETVAALCIDACGYAGIGFADLVIMTNLSEKQLGRILQQLLSERTVVLIDRDQQAYIHRNHFERLQARTIEYLEAYHAANPLKKGMPKEELRSKFPAFLNAKIFTLLLNQLIRAETIVQSEDMVRLAGHSVSLGADQSDLQQKILEIYRQDDLTPPYFKALVQSLAVDSKRAREVLMLLVEEGHIIKTKDDLFFHGEAVKRLRQKLIDFFNTHDEMTAPQFKEMTGVSRKYLIPLLEYFDGKNVTIRVGDVRKLRGS